MVSVRPQDGDGKDEVIVGPGGGGNPKIRVFNAEVGQPANPFEFAVWSPAWTGGVRVGAADLTGDSRSEILTGVASGSEPVYSVHDGLTGTAIASGLAFNVSFSGGIFVAGGTMSFDEAAPRPAFIVGQEIGIGAIRVIDAQTGYIRHAFDPFAGTEDTVYVAYDDVTGDGVADIVAVPGGGPFLFVRVFDGNTGLLVTAFDTGWKDVELSITTGDLDGDGRAEIIATNGSGYPASIRVFDGWSGAFRSSYAPASSGVRTLAAGDVDGDGIDEVIAGPLYGSGPVRVVNGLSGQVRRTFYAYHPNYSGGLDLAAGDVDGDGKAEIITTPRGSGPYVRIFDGLLDAPTVNGDGSTGLIKSWLRAHDPTYLGDVRLAAGDVNSDGRADVIVTPVGSVETDVRAYDGTSGEPFFASSPVWPTYTGGGWIAAGPTRGAPMANPPVGPPPNHAPAVAPTSMTVPANFTGAMTVGNALAADPEDAVLSYAIVGGNTQGHFSIDAATGAIRLAAYSPVAAGTYSLTIEVNDGTSTAAGFAQVSVPPGVGGGGGGGGPGGDPGSDPSTGLDGQGFAYGWEGYIVQQPLPFPEFHIQTNYNFLALPDYWSWKAHLDVGRNGIYEQSLEYGHPNIGPSDFTNYFSRSGEYWVGKLPFSLAAGSGPAKLKLEFLDADERLVRTLYFAIDLWIGDNFISIDIPGDLQGLVGGEYRLRFGAGSEPIVTHVLIDWGDGTARSISGEELNNDTGWYELTHVYAAAGVYTIRVTATNVEDGSWSAEHQVVIGNLNAPMPTPTDPVITAYATILPDGRAKLTVSATDVDGDPVVQYQWDLNGDGYFDPIPSNTREVYLTPEAGVYYPYTATVRVTDAAGRTTEALLAFVYAGPVRVSIGTARTYAKNFRRATPDLPSGANDLPEEQRWEVHHMKQQVLEQRYRRQRGINIHENPYLRGVPREIHKDITNAQDAWWRQKAREITGRADELALQQAYREVPWNEIDEFEQNLAQRYQQYWIQAGPNQVVRVTEVNNLVRVNRSAFAIGQGARWGALGITLPADAGGLFQLIGTKVEFLRNICTHTSQQLAAMNLFIDQYNWAVQEAVETGRLTRHRAFQLEEAFLAYCKSFPIDGDSLDALNVFDAMATRYILAHCHDASI